MKLTRSQENEIKIAANLHGFDVPFTSEGDIDPLFAIAFGLGKGIGKLIEKGHEDLAIKAINETSKITGVSAKKQSK